MTVPGYDRTVPVEFSPQECRQIIAALDVTALLVDASSTREQHQFLIRRLKNALAIDEAEKVLKGARNA